MINQASPYTSFESWKKYLVKENAIPVPQRVHLASDDLELYNGNNMQLHSIQRNRVLNHADGKITGDDLLGAGLTVFQTLWGTKTQANTQAQQNAALARQQEEAAKTRLMWQRVGIGFGIFLLLVAVIALRK